MLYCFLQDKSLHSRAVGSFNDSEISAGWGFVTDYLKSYFKDPLSLADDRANRLIVDGKTSILPMTLSLDEEFDTSGIDFETMDPVEKDKLFNVIEVLTYYTHLDDTAIENVLQASSTDFGVYINDSMVRSSSADAVDFYENSVDANITTNVQSWISFRATLGGVEETFKIWIEVSAFTDDYPDTYFVKTIYPADPNDLLAKPGATILNTTADNSSYIFGELIEDVEDKDNTGIVNFPTRYFPSMESIGDQVVIGVLYKGQQPSTQATRDFIRADLLGLGLATQSTWEWVLPDLFIDGKYFILPIWDNFTSLPDAIQLPIGILNWQKARDVAEEVLPTFDPAYIDSHLEILVSPASEFFMVGIADEGNTPLLQHLIEEHPTYQPVDARQAHFAHQSVDTQHFNREFSSAVAVLTGANNTSTFTEDEINGRMYITFISNHKEYHVLKPTSYPGLI